MDPDAVVIDMNEHYLILASTPVALYYEGQEKKTIPLLCAGDNPDTPNDGVSKGVIKFLSVYGPSEVLGIGQIPGEVKTTDSVTVIEPEEASIELARRYWSQSDGALIIKEDENS